MEWDLHESNAVCRQLGYDGAVAAPSWSAFGPGSVMIAMNHIHCMGQENSVSDCRFMSWQACHPPLRSPSAVCAQSGKSNKQYAVSNYM